MERFNIMIVGDVGTGKTCLSVVFLDDIFPDFFISVSDRQERYKTINGKCCSICLYEDSTKGCDYDHLRPMYYPGTDVFIALYSVESRKSLENLRHRWIPEVRSYVPHVPFIIVANKIDLRGSGEFEDTITPTEGYNAAKQLGTSYLELCCKRKQGIDECFSHAVELALLNTKKIKKALNMTVVIPPLKPPAAPEPVVGASPSSLTEDWLQMMSNQRFHDVKLTLEDGSCYFCHKVVLCSESSFFRKIFLTGFSSDMSDSLNRDDVNSGKIPGIHRVYDSLEGRETTIELTSDIKADTFAKVLEFIYTGCLSVKSNEMEISALKCLAELLDLTPLVSRCDEMLSNQDNEESNQDLVVVSNGTRIGELLKQEMFSDILFNVKGSLIPAHKVVVCGRNSKMVSLVDALPEDEKSSTEISIDADVENFSCLLEFLYTDQIHLDDSKDVIGLLKLADEYQACRLVSLCEEYLKKGLESMCKDEKDLKAIELLQKLKACNARQMVDWCRHHICHNYATFEGKEEFQTLDEDDQMFIKKHRWPPANYLLEVEDFERNMSLIPTAETKKKCVIQ